MCELADKRQILNEDNVLEPIPLRGTKMVKTITFKGIAIVKPYHWRVGVAKMVKTIPSIG